MCHKCQFPLQNYNAYYHRMNTDVTLVVRYGCTPFRIRNFNFERILQEKHLSSFVNSNHVRPSFRVSGQRCVRIYSVWCDLSIIEIVLSCSIWWSKSCMHWQRRHKEQDQEHREILQRSRKHRSGISFTWQHFGCTSGRSPRSICRLVTSAHYSFSWERHEWRRVVIFTLVMIIRNIMIFMISSAWHNLRPCHMFWRLWMFFKDETQRKECFVSFDKL